MYFDYTATTKMDEEILKTYIEIQEKYYANTTSLHLLGQKCNNIYEQMKSEIRNIFQIDGNIIFVSNATEANNLAIQGIIGNKKGKLITTKIEHPSVFEVFKQYEKNGYEVVYLNVDKNGIIDLEELNKEMNKDVLLVSIMWVNNIIGAIEPIEEVIKIVQKYPKCKLHVDAVQGVCKIKPKFSFQDIDAFTISAHKIYGPKGIGLLVYKKNLELKKMLFGSSAQEGVKPGTFDLGLVVCAAKALKKYWNLTDYHFESVMKIKEYLLSKINNKNIIINSSEYCSPYIVNISVPSILGETIVHIFESKELFVSTGSACSSKLRKPEKTVYAVTLDENLAKTTIRISLSHLTTTDEIDKLAETLNEIGDK